MLCLLYITSSSWSTPGENINQCHHLQQLCYIRVEFSWNICIHASVVHGVRYTLTFKPWPVC